MQTTEQSRVMPSISSDMRALYDAHFDLVWRYMTQRNVRQAHIDDLVLKVFRVVREHPSRYQMQDKPAVLVCMVARQVLREHQHTDEGAASSDDADALTEVFERDAISELVLGGLEAMTDIEREAYLLCEGEGMSMEDVALAVGVPELAVQRKRARASRQMNEFLAKMRNVGIWRSSQVAREEDLLRSLHAACTPSERDRDRVFAAMIAHSLSMRPLRSREPAAVAPASSTPAPRPSASFSKQAAASAQEGTPAPLALSWPPRALSQGSGRIWLTAGLAVALLAVGMGSRFLGSTHAAEKPRAERVAQEATPQRTGASGPQQNRPARPLAAIPASTVREQQPPSPSPVLPTPTELTKPDAKRTRTTEPEKSEGKRAHVSEAKLLFAAQRAYLSGNAAAALVMVSKHQHDYPSSAYTVERKVLLGQILCTKARHREAQRVVLELEAMEANPAALAAVYRTCAGKP